MEKFIWDGPEDSEEEVAEMVPMKTDYETECGLKYSKNVVKYGNRFSVNNSPSCTHFR